MDVVIARPFNHVGPGQREDFVLPSFLSRIAEAAHAGTKEIPVGDLASERDFTDVRDVARAYAVLAERGETGKAYNICSSQLVSIRTLLDLAIEITGLAVVPVVDRNLTRV